MTKQDRINQAKTLISRKGPDMSSRAIAKLTGLDKYEVNALRSTPTPSVVRPMVTRPKAKCKHPKLLVISCNTHKGHQWRRVRECKDCGKEFNTVEVLIS